MIVGLTGGIGSGKSFVANCFADLGVPIYNSDLEAREICNSDKTVVTAIKGVFGENIYKNALLDRVAVAKIVFEDKQLLRQLNDIVHPAVKLHFENWYHKQNFKFVIKESAILMESGGAKACDKIILVTAPLTVRQQRVMARDGMSEADFKQRVKNQWEDNKKRPLSNFVIENIDSQQTRIEVARIYHQLLS